MGVDLRRRDIGMAEQLLHDAQIGAVLQQMAGEGMAQHVRADIGGAQAGRGGERLQSRAKCWRVRWPLSPKEGNSHSSPRPGASSSAR